MAGNPARHGGPGGGRARIAALVTLALVVLRALIPAGYMPDLDAARDGRFTVVICTADGSTTLDLLSDGTPADERPAKSPAQDHCVFGGATILGLAAAPIALGVVDAATDVRAGIPADVTLPPTRAGPPLGSRAPPSLS